jgi:hypothetical protein
MQKGKSETAVHMMKQIALAVTLFLTGAQLFAQQSGPAESSAARGQAEELNAPEALEFIFSNLGPRSDPYNTEALWLPVAGKDSSTDPEQWQAVRFSPKVDVQAKVLTAALQYVSGVREVKLGLYDNNDILNTVGTLLPGGEGSTTEIPDLDDCCQLAKVTLGGEGVTLFAHQLYWLVASTSDSAQDFTGRWRLSRLALSGTFSPGFPWRNLPGQWPAAEIRGTRLQGANPTNMAKAPELPSRIETPAAKVTIFTNLGSATDRYLASAFNGSVVAGRDSTSQPEIWQALPFTPRRDVHATTLAAAIGWISGTRKVDLSLYSDSGGTVGTPLPGAQGSTTDIPDAGACCEVARVKFAQPVALSSGVQYWCVASPDETAEDFTGLWQHSILAVRAYNQPEFFTGWTSVSGDWLAAEIRGTNP